MTAEFTHDALFYGNDAEYVAGLVPFVTDGLTARESVIIAVPPNRIDLLRAELGPLVEGVTFVNMAEMGHNPARMIPAWQSLVTNRSGPVRGIGEPIWAERGEEEITESLLHESLVDLAFQDGNPFWLRCLYDTTTLDPRVVAAARLSHSANGAVADDRAVRFAEPLPAPADSARRWTFGLPELPGLRKTVTEHASTLGLAPERVADLVLAVNEIATNSVRYGGAEGELAIWPGEKGIVCEISDHGVIGDPLVGRRLPTVTQVGGRGVWLANQLCDLVQLRSSDAGTVVRLHMST